MDLSVFPSNNLNELDGIKFIINDRTDFLKMLDFFDMCEDDFIQQDFGEKGYYCILFGMVRRFIHPEIFHYHSDTYCREINLYPEFIKKPNLVFKL